jgi:hypothetical protein
MVLDAPDCPKAFLIGERDLLKAFAVGATFGHALAPGVLTRPGFGDVDLVEKAQFHPLLPFARFAVKGSLQ